MNSTPSLNVAARRGSRAIGAMFFSVFGAAWLVLWSNRTFGLHFPVLGLVATGSLVLFGCSLMRYRENREALAVEAELPHSRRAGRIFNMVNAAQWILIFVMINVLTNIGRAAWIMPAVMGIIGLHFLPLAHVFSYRPHYVAGCALMLLAGLYPLLAAGGPADPIGCLGAGLILWSSAAWALMADSSRGR